jgi:hypothetical protein
VDIGLEEGDRDRRGGLCRLPQAKCPGSVDGERENGRGEERQEAARTRNPTPKTPQTEAVWIQTAWR